jgi:hypothetical protein
VGEQSGAGDGRRCPGRGLAESGAHRARGVEELREASRALVAVAHDLRRSRRGRSEQRAEKLVAESLGR